MNADTRPPDSPDVPVFVVVGHVNRGKSSIVSTLAADENVRIDPTPGTTRHCRSYPLRVDGRTLYVLVDTPGFERARHVLDWLRRHETTTADRRALVERFMREQASTGAFPQEIELLRPILAGGAILFVVDGSVPFNPSHEAEMEILRWTAQPRMALINSIGRDDYVAQWRPVLDQYFSLVRLFDAHQAGFEHRLALLRTLRELSDQWRPAIESAIEALVQDRRRSRRESAAVIADMMADMLGMVEERRLTSHEPVEPRKAELAARFHDRLRRRERDCRQTLLEIYTHGRLQVSEHDLEPLGGDLFDLTTWSRLGLSRGQLAATGALTFAAIGGGIDLATGGMTLGLGTAISGAIGGALGLAGSWLAWVKLTEVRVLGQSLGGPLLRAGPIRQPNFPWIVLDRALLYHDAVAERAHARRDPVSLESEGERAGPVSRLDGPTRRSLQDCFDRLRRRRDPLSIERAREDLARHVEAILGKMPAGQQSE